MALELSEDTQALIRRHLEDGDYQTAEEVIAAGVALLDSDLAADIRALRAEILKGERSGPATVFDIDAFLKEANAAYNGEN